MTTSANYTLVLAVDIHGPIAYMIFLGGMQTEDFCGFLSLMFDREDINTQEVEHVLLMDNCKSHKNDFTFGTLYRKYPIIYNAPYTP